MAREHLFNDLIGLSEETKTHLLCRLFGAFESNKPMTSEYFFEIVELFVEREKRKTESVLNSENGGISASKTSIGID